MKIEQLLTSDSHNLREIGRRILEKKLPISLNCHYGTAAYFTLADGSGQFAIIAPIREEPWMCGGISVSDLDPKEVLRELGNNNVTYSPTADLYEIKSIDQLIQIFEIIIKNSQYIS